MTAEEINSDHNPVLLTLDSTLPAQVLNRDSYKEVSLNVYMECLKWIIFPFDEYQCIDALETGNEAFSSTLVSARRIGEVNRLQEALKHFHDLGDFITKMPQAKRRWQK